MRSLPWEKDQMAPVKTMINIWNYSFAQFWWVEVYLIPISCDLFEAIFSTMSTSVMKGSVKSRFIRWKLSERGPTPANQVSLPSIASSLTPAICKHQMNAAEQYLPLECSRVEIKLQSNGQKRSVKHLSNCKQLDSVAEPAGARHLKDLSASDQIYF